MKIKIFIVISAIMMMVCSLHSLQAADQESGDVPVISNPAGSGGQDGPDASAKAQTPNVGAEQVVIKAVGKGNVSFPHRLHQSNLGDCNLCHTLFPQELGSIDRLKADGQLKSKQVMNTQCIKCHKEKKQQGAKAGPTGCASCHIK